MKTGMLISTLATKGLKEADSAVGKLAVAGARTLSESGTEMKLALAGIGLNIAAQMFDLDAPLKGVGLDFLVGADGFLDNAGDILIGGAAASAGYKFVNNVQKVWDQDLTDEQILEEFGCLDLIEA